MKFKTHNLTKDTVAILTFAEETINFIETAEGAIGIHNLPQNKDIPTPLRDPLAVLKIAMKTYLELEDGVEFVRLAKAYHKATMTMADDDAMFFINRIMADTLLLDFDQEIAIKSIDCIDEFPEYLDGLQENIGDLDYMLKFPDIHPEVSKHFKG